MTDKLKLVAAMLILVVGIGGFYYFGDQSGPVRLAILLVAGIAAIVMFYQTTAGKATWEFVKGARQELRKVVWPNQKETTQITIVVFVMAVLVALFLWAVDWGLHKIISAVTA